jgi:hypothetical protein
VALTDPDNNYAIGRHFYGSSFDTYNPLTPINLQEAVNQSGINVSMYHYFDDPTKDMYLQSVLALNIPNGWVISEFGPTDNESMVDNPSVGNMAYAMQFLREAATHNVTVINYRIGTYSEEGLYEATALTDFNQPYFTPPQPPTATLLDLVALAKAYGSTPGSPNWNPASDLNKDGVVNLIDLMTLAHNSR